MSRENEILNKLIRACPYLTTEKGDYGSLRLPHLRIKIEHTQYNENGKLRSKPYTISASVPEFKKRAFKYYSDSIQTYFNTLVAHNKQLAGQQQKNRLEMQQQRQQYLQRYPERIEYYRNHFDTRFADIYCLKYGEVWFPYEPENDVVTLRNIRVDAKAFHDFIRNQMFKNRLLRKSNV